MVKDTFVKKLALAVLWLFQILIILAGIYALTSTIKILPWYEPLTMGAFLLLIYLLPLQFIVYFIFKLLYKKLIISTLYNIMSLINLAILGTIPFIVIIKESLFYPFAVFYSIIQAILLLAWILLFKKFIIS